jgi:protein farnesyltransferase/geranylgeranyltransferase type-1 subunit alpha
MDELCLKNMKYYQVWSHRKLLLLYPSTLSSSSIANTFSAIPPKPAQELAYLSRVLATDAKNYHTWAYRQWILTYYGDTHPNLWEHELIATDILIEDDVRNNSAWHHRFFISFASGAQSDVTERELAFVKSKISLAPNNLSAWNYLRGILDKMGIKYATLRTFVEPYSISRAGGEASAKDEEAEAEVEVYDLDNPRPSLAAELPCALAIEFMADLCEQEGENDKAAEVCFIDHQHHHCRLNAFPAFQ